MSVQSRPTSNGTGPPNAAPPPSKYYPPPSAARLYFDQLGDGGEDEDDGGGGGGDGYHRYEANYEFDVDEHSVDVVDDGEEVDDQHRAEDNFVVVSALVRIALSTRECHQP